MQKKAVLAAFFFFSFTFKLIAGERNIPVDFILMIDKSRSMQEPDRFESLQRWVLDELIAHILILNDWISIYQFYERPEHLLSLEIRSKNDMRHAARTVSSIKPDGKFTDIGLALEAVQAAAKERGANGRHKVLIIITDLEQDAPFHSRYAGKQARFKSPYLAEARIIKHGGWFEITLDMDIQERVVRTTKKLYSDILHNEKKARNLRK